MNLIAAPVFEIVRLIDLQPSGETGFCMLVGAPAAPQLMPDLQEELAIQLDASLRVVDVAGVTVSGLTSKLRASRESVVLMHGFSGWSDLELASLDINRSRLETGSFLVFSVDAMTAGRFLDNAPNIRSYLGANIFTVAPDPSGMTPGDISDRLTQLGGYYGLSNAEVIERARNGSLPSDPHFMEWLVFLGRSELAR